MKMKHLLSATALAGSLIAIPSAWAQDAAPQTDQSAETPTQDTILVTGSRIRRPDLESTVPVATLKGEDIYKQANTNLGETLNNLPQLRSTFAQQNPGLGIGIAGLNLLDLRGLGVQRTLVLVNGRRHVPGDIQNTASAVDINSIPTDLVERVEIVTGGNSAVYGSDAIAGVVNFVLKDNFDGAQIRAGAALPEFGSGGSHYVNGIFGKNFADGRGNVAIAGEYTVQDRLFGSQIPWLRNSNGFITNDVDGAGLTNGSDGIPDTVFARNIRTTTISRYGLIPIVETRNAAAPCGTGIASGTGVRTNYNCNYLFDSLGNLVQQTGNRVGSGPTGTFIGGNGDNNREDRLLSIMPMNNRYTANLIGHYEFSDAATLFVEAKYARAHTQGSNSGPAFNQGFNQTYADYRANYRLDNPFLSASARTTIANAILASGSNTGLTGGAALSAADIAAIANGTYRFTLARNFTDLGIRDEDTVRETYRVVVGLRGDLTPHVNYEISANYGRTNEDVKILGNVNVQRLILAQDAGIDPANPGAGIQCRSKFDPAARGVVADVDGVANSYLAADIAACVPYNPFGGLNNDAARNYIVNNSGDHGHMSQIDVTGFVSLDTGGFFKLPGGAVSLVLGGEWRREDANFKADPDIEAGLTFLNALQTFNPPTAQVTEGFGELNIPLLKDMPFFKSLSLSGAARVSKYNSAYGDTGTTWAWNFGGEWAPIPDIRFRANYGKAVRAPNYTETQAPFGQNFAPGFLDPCNSGRIGAGTAQRVTNCQAALGANINNADFQSLTNLGYSLEILTGSNPLLKAETSKSLTVGAVLTPRFIPGFDLTVDYYDINVENVISTASAQTIVNLCYDEGQFCNLFQRNNTATTGPAGERPGQILQGSLIQAGLNFASLKRRGIDFQMNYNHAISSNARLTASLYYTHQLKNSNYTDPTRPAFESRVLGQLGDPQDEVVFRTDLTVNKFKFGYGAHYIGPMLTTAYSNIYSINGNPPANEDVIDIRQYPSVLYHNLRFGVQLGATSDNRKGFEWFGGIDNVADKHPPLGSTAVGSGSAIYDIMGRTFYTGVRATF
ncbi:TonB-dependent receptor [Sphingomonas sp. KR3-1]|uniref:TonB-dependent receptor domain-containing protein n=1 Tax=Sphingomonas sp. KR3-1 TaxID=3156611 RepID=UPI0032B39E15